MDSPQIAAPRLDAIDAMRGYAILGVVLAHTAQWTKPPPGWPAQLCANGANGVQLFFVASAFALFLSDTRRRPGERRPVADFFVRRFFRIAPMFYAGLLFFVCLAGNQPRFWAPRGITLLDIGLTATFLHGWHPETINAVVPGGWSIAAEAMFYLLLPALFRLIRSRTHALLFLAATLALEAVTTIWLAPLLTPAYPPGFAYLAENFRFFWIFGELPVFALGILLYFLVRDRPDVPDRRVGWACLAGAAGITAGLFWQLHPPLPPPFQSVVLQGVAFMLFGLGLHLVRSPILVNRAVVFLGSISYSLYFVHFAVFQYLFRHWPGGLPMSGSWTVVPAWLLVLAVSSAIAYLTYRWIEQPGIALGRRIVAHLEATRTPGGTG